MTNAGRAAVTSISRTSNIGVNSGSWDFSGVDLRMRTLGRVRHNGSVAGSGHGQVVDGVGGSCRFCCGLGGLRDDGCDERQHLDNEAVYDFHLQSRLCHHLPAGSTHRGVDGRPHGCGQCWPAARVCERQHLYVHPEGVANGRPTERCGDASSPGHAERDRPGEPFRFLGDVGT